MWLLIANVSNTLFFVYWVMSSSWSHKVCTIHDAVAYIAYKPFIVDKKIGLAG